MSTKDRARSDAAPADMSNPAASARADFAPTVSARTVEPVNGGTFQPPHAQAARRAPAITLPLADALISVVVARRAAYRLQRQTHVAQRLAALADTLERQLPPTVTQTALAEALGVSRQTIKRWVVRGRIPLEQARPGARPGVPTAVALQAIAETERVRGLPLLRRARPVGGALHLLQVLRERGA